jgi:hypothetical protein
MTAPRRPRRKESKFAMEYEIHVRPNGRSALYIDECRRVFGEYACAFCDMGWSTRRVREIDEPRPRKRATAPARRKK